MYHPLLYMHSYIRWGILFLAAYLVVDAIRNKQNPTSNTERFGALLTWYVILLDVQLLVGLIMYLFYSPQIQHAFQDFGAAMKRTDLRFWAVEHPILMGIVLVLGHIAKAKFKKATEHSQQLRTPAILIGISLLILLIVIPWPFSWVPRPLLRF